LRGKGFEPLLSNENLEISGQDSHNQYLNQTP